MKQYVITRINNIYTGFLFEDGHAIEIRPYDEKSNIGSVYIGRVSNIVPNINACFVDIKKGVSCYLSLEDYNGSAAIKCGDIMPVQIIKDGVKNKKATVSANISLAGEYVIVEKDYLTGVSSKITAKEKRSGLKKLLADALLDFETEKKRADISYGGIVRTRAENADVSLIHDEIIKLLRELDGILCSAGTAAAYSCLYQPEFAYIRDIRGFLKDGAFVITDCKDIYDRCLANDLNVSLYSDSMTSLNAEYRIKGLLDKCLSKNVSLRSGAYLVIEPTEALTVIDVNSGRAVRGSDAEEIRFRINVEAAREVARQLKLRNISGIVVIDFISMKSEAHQKALMDKLKEFVSYDSVHTDVVDITKLGLVELTRKKIRKPIYEVFGK